MFVLFLYFLVLVFFSLYSFVLVDPNFTLFNHPLWTFFRNYMVQIGYYQRSTSVTIYLLLITLLFAFHFFFKKNQKKYSGFKLAFLVSSSLFFSYPFLSHDFFNYLFDAKIFTYYHQNPYLHSGLDFPTDSWLRFMHWTHRTYPYGPVFLVFSFIPSFLALGKFILNFYFFKLAFIGVFLIAIFLTQKINNRWAIFLATQPLIIIEGLNSLHNDFVALSLALIGLYFLLKPKSSSFLARIFLLFSAGIKYLSAPSLLIVKSKPKFLNYLGMFFLMGILLYFSFGQEVQPWYFLNLFIFLPSFEKFIKHLSIFFAGLLLSYYPYLLYGGWDSQEKIFLKHQIILAGLILNLSYFFYLFFFGKRR